MKKKADESLGGTATNKKQKTKAGSNGKPGSGVSDNGDASKIDIFVNNGDILPAILSFLNPRDLYQLTKCCKAFTDPKMKLLDYKVVMHSAMLADERTYRTIENIIPCIKDRSIWTPSPLRLLRLVNGRFCEKCNNFPVASSLSGEMGVFFCYKCLHSRDNTLISIDPRCLTRDGTLKEIGLNKTLITHKRVAKAKIIHYIFKAVVKDAASNNIGPIFDFDEYESLQKTHTVDSFLAEKDKIDVHRKHVEDILQCYEEKKEEAKRRQEKREEPERKRQMQILKLFGRQYPSI